MTPRSLDFKSRKVTNSNSSPECALAAEIFGRDRVDSLTIPQAKDLTALVKKTVSGFEKQCKNIVVRRYGLDAENEPVSDHVALAKLLRVGFGTVERNIRACHTNLRSALVPKFPELSDSFRGSTPRPM